jgi:fumarate hydratase subunit beta
MKQEVKQLETPLSEDIVRDLQVGDKVFISGKIYCGRDAVLPRIAQLAREGKLAAHGIDLKGSVIFHSAISAAGLGPTSSNKPEIEENMPLLAQAGVKLYLGKGEISAKTIAGLAAVNSVFALIPPITAILKQNILSQKIAAFPELGMEAFYELRVKNYPAIIAAADNESIYIEERT